jgi:hypothetical protein
MQKTSNRECHFWGMSLTPHQIEFSPLTRSSPSDACDLQSDT